ncbi:MAG TPA: glycosyl hydrolase family 28-related protein [Longimicrobium sp.]|jgi:hypothetical protein|nr:glycosyl hydrolase family 28-related protein [Longimicrobium sp.]
MPTYDGTLLDQGGAVFNVRSSTYGAVGNGVANDTAAIQAAVNAAAAVRGTVLIPPGTYSVTSIQLAPGITVSGYGATLKRPNSQANWTRTLYIPETGTGSWNNASDSALLTIEGLTIDGNSANQGSYRNYELQHAHLIFLSGNASNAGRLRVNLRDLVLKNSVADGISLYVNVDAQITDCRADSCFRGGLVLTGGNTRAQVQNFATTGALDVTGIDVEIDGAGYGSSYAVDLEVDGMLLDGDFDVSLGSGSRFYATNVVSGPGFYLNAQGSTVNIADSRFQVGSYSSEGNRIVYPHDVTFQNVTFELAGVSEVGAVDGAAAHIFWNVAGTTVGGQRCRFLDCDFRVASSVSQSLTLAAVYAEADILSQDNRLIVEGGTISSAYDIGFVMAQGGRWVVKETEIEAATGFDWVGVTTQWGTYTSDLRIERVVFRGSTKYMNLGGADTANILDHRDVVLEAAQNVLSAPYGLVATFRGGRIIRVTADPTTTATPGLVGDVARRATPTAGAVYEWVCTAGSTSSATWKVATTLSA